MPPHSPLERPSRWHICSPSCSGRALPLVQRPCETSLLPEWYLSLLHRLQNTFHLICIVLPNYHSCQPCATKSLLPQHSLEFRPLLNISKQLHIVRQEDHFQRLCDTTSKLVDGLWKPTPRYHNNQQ